MLLSSFSSLKKKNLCGNHEFFYVIVDHMKFDPTLMDEFNFMSCKRLLHETGIKPS